MGTFDVISRSDQDSRALNTAIVIWGLASNTLRTLLFVRSDGLTLEQIERLVAHFAQAIHIRDIGMF